MKLITYFFGSLFALVATLGAQQVAAPVFSPQAGTSAVQFNVTVTSPTPNAVIRYTLSGVDPTPTDPILTNGGTVVVTNSTLKAKAWDGNATLAPSDVTSATYSVVGEITGGGTHALSLRSDGKLYAWGQQGSGRLGNNLVATLSVLNPVRTFKGSSATTFDDAASIAGGYDHSVVTDQAGYAWAFGNNASYQLGNNTVTDASVATHVLKTNSTTPTAADYLGGVIQAEAGTSYSLALASNDGVNTHGEVWAWGLQTNGRLGNGLSTGSSRFAVKVTDAASVPLTGVTSIAAGTTFGVAVDGNVDAQGKSGRVWAWGYNVAGQLGNGTVTQQLRATKVQLTGTMGNDLTDVVSVAAGEAHTVALRWSAAEVGTVWCWGQQANGRLGNNLTATASIKNPVKVLKAGGLPLDHIVQVAAGPMHSVALDDTGKVWAWGYNQDGNLGNGGTVQSGVAIQIPISLPSGVVIVSIGAGGTSTNGFTLAIASNGVAYSWGYNAHGELGNGTTTAKNAPAIAANGYKFVNQPPTTLGLTVTGDFYSNGVLTFKSVPADPDGTISRVDFYWDGAFVASDSAAPYQVSPPTSMVVPGNHAVMAQAFDNNGASLIAVTNITVANPALPVVPPPAETAPVQYFYDTPGSLVARNLTVASAPVITLPLPAFQVASLNGDVSLSIAVTDGAATYQWKFNGVDILGATSDTLFLPGVTAANQGEYSVVVTNSNGSVSSSGSRLFIDSPSFSANNIKAWGSAFYGESTIPAGLSNVISIAANRHQSLALKSDGSAVAWGRIGDYSAYVPAGLNQITAIAAGGYHCLAIKSDGTVTAWGYNNALQINVPPTLTAAVAIAAGANHSMALTKDGTIMVWGDNSYGQTSQPSFLNGVVAIAAGDNHSLALKSDGTVVAWGSNSYGQRTVPVGLSGVVAIAAGTYHSLALKNDGTVVAWGANSLGQTSIPVGLSGVASIAAGGDHNLALKLDGTVVAWGNNAAGESSVIVGLNNVLAVAAGGSHSLALMGTEPGTAAPVIVNSPLALGMMGSPFNFRVQAKNAGTAYTAVGLPTGLSIDSATGQITGTPTAAGTFTITLSATNASGTSTSTLILTIDRVTPIITSVTSARAHSGSPFNYQVTATNSPIGYSATGLPAGLAINASTGQITGSTTAPVGTYNVSLSASNLYGAGKTMVMALTIQTVAEWGSGYTTPVVPSGLVNVTALAAGSTHSLALKWDGTVVAWGSNGQGQSTVPVGLSSVASIAAGDLHSLALKTDGTVVGWGYNGYGQITIPVGLSGVVAIDGGVNHSLVLKSDGSVAVWGQNTYGQANVPAGLSGVVAIAAGSYHSVALKADGTVVAWGLNGNGQINVPAGLSGVVAIAAGTYHTVAFKSDGAVVAWGANAVGESTTPSGLTGVASITAATAYTGALKLNGTITAWGSDGSAMITSGAPLANVASLVAHGSHALALMATEPSVATPVIINSPFALGCLNCNFNSRIVAKNFPTSFDATGLPDGLTINAVTGQITGIPTVVGTFPVTLSATNASGTSTAALTLTVN